MSSYLPLPLRSLQLVQALQRNLYVLLYVCPHTSIYMFLILVYMCPHTSIYMCPHASTYVSPYLPLPLRVLRLVQALIEFFCLPDQFYRLQRFS